MLNLFSRTYLSVLFGFVAFVGSARASDLRGQFALGPDNNQSLLLQTLQSAKSELDINVYEFKSETLAQKLAERIQAGVTVRLLVEGQPVGGLSQEGRQILNFIKTAMTKSRNKAHRLWVMTRQSDQPRRYRFNHAKYVIADQKTIHVSSENFNPNGHPDSGKVGNRGWDFSSADERTAFQLKKLFDLDTDTQFGDLVDLSRGGKLPVLALDVMPINFLGSALKLQMFGAPPPYQRHDPLDRSLRAESLGEGNLDQVSIVSSPHSLGGLVDLLRSARHSLSLEFMSLPSQWKEDESPLVAELKRAAQRGVTVRMLLNDDRVFGGKPEQWANHKTVQELNAWSQDQRMPLQARIVDINALQISAIHNKGILVDGSRVLVSSINGTANSIENNRELGVVLEGQSAANYYGNSFDADWMASSTLRF